MTLCCTHNQYHAEPLSEEHTPASGRDSQKLSRVTGFGTLSPKTDMSTQSFLLEPENRLDLKVRL